MRASEEPRCGRCRRGHKAAQCASEGPSSERSRGRHCPKSLDSGGKKSISKLGLLSVYMIKNDKVLPFIFIKRQKAEQNNLLSSSARFICLAKPGGGRKDGWKAVAAPCLHSPQCVGPWRVAWCGIHFLIPRLQPRWSSGAVLGSAASLRDAGRLPPAPSLT